MKLLDKLKRLPSWAYAVIGVGLGVVLFLMKPKTNTGQVAVVGPDQQDTSTKMSDVQGQVSGLTAAVNNLQNNQELLNSNFASLSSVVMTGLGGAGLGTGPTANSAVGDSGVSANHPVGQPSAVITPSVPAPIPAPTPASAPSHTSDSNIVETITSASGYVSPVYSTPQAAAAAGGGAAIFNGERHLVSPSGFIF